MDEVCSSFMSGSKKYLTATKTKNPPTSLKRICVPDASVQSITATQAGRIGCYSEQPGKAIEKLFRLLTLLEPC